MFISYGYWQIQITHTPTGISALRSSQNYRTKEDARKSAMRYIRSRLYMLGYPPIKACDLLIEAV